MSKRGLPLGPDVSKLSRRKKAALKQSLSSQDLLSAGNTPDASLQIPMGPHPSDLAAGPSQSSLHASKDLQPAAPEVNKQAAFMHSSNQPHSSFSGNPCGFANQVNLSTDYSECPPTASKVIKQAAYTQVSNQPSSSFSGTPCGFEDQVNLPTGLEACEELKMPAAASSLDPDPVNKIYTFGDLHLPLPWAEYLDLVQENDSIETQPFEEITISETPPEVPSYFELTSDNDKANDEYEDKPDLTKPLVDDNKVNITMEESFISILCFAQKKKLSGTDLTDLLELIDIHLRKPNNMETSIYKFFKYLDFADTEVSISYYCSSCWRSCASMKDLCQKCRDPKRTVHYFIYVPIAQQIAKMYSRPGFLEKIKYKHTRVKKVAENIEDIYDGSLYKEAQKTILADDKNISLKWNTDGVCLYECSSYSLWPFYFVINELPPDERYKPENVIIGGLWGSREKPHPNVFLKDITAGILKLRDGLDVTLSDGESTNVKVIVLCGTCDSPAKSTFLNFKSHSGFSSCPICYTVGERSKRTGDVVTFPFEEEMNSRTEESWKSDVNESRKIKDDFRGVKGPSLLFLMCSFFACTSTAVDSMHNIYLGLTKQLLNLWFNPTFHDKPFSLSKKVKEVNEKLMSFSFPHFVERLSVPVDKLPLWKASLCRNFFFYVSLPLLKDFLPPVYFEHFSKLVEGASLLNSRSKSETDKIRADLLLQQFSKDFEKLYSARHMSHNLHLSRHLAKMVSLLGPLWATSCFMFEDLNGKLAHLAHGTKNAALQIATNLSILTSLPLRVKKMQPNRGKDYCLKLLKKLQRLNLNEKITDYIYTVGSHVKSCQEDELIAKLICNYFHIAFSFPFETFTRLSKYNRLFVAKNYDRGSRVSSFVQYDVQSLSQFKIGEIITFVKVNMSPSTFYAALIKIIPVHRFIPTINYMYVEEETEISQQGFILCPVEKIGDVCFSINVDGKFHVSVPLNDFEME